jgi:hypothetical protein
MSENKNTTGPKSAALLQRNGQTEKIIVNTILYLTVIGIFIVIVGIVWAIGDLFSKDKLQLFLDASIQTQIFTIGLILLGVFFLSLFLVVLYKRRRDTIQGALFKDKPKSEMKEEEEYGLAKFITAGGLISIILVILGLIIALLQYLITGDELEDPLGIVSFLGSLEGGSAVIAIGFAVLIFDFLIYGFIYVWLNGQWLVINKILLSNKQVQETHPFTKNEKVVGRIIFGLIVVELVMIVFGIVWAIIESITTDWGAIFDTYPLGIKISFYGLFAALLFATMIFATFFYKRGMNMIMTAVFVRKIPKSQSKDNLYAKIITGGFLVGITLIVLGLGIWVIQLLVDLISTGGSTGNIFTILHDLSSGLELLAYGSILEIFTFLTLAFIFFMFNGYAWSMEKILKIEQSIDGGLEGNKQKAAELREQRAKDREEKKAAKKAEKKKLKEEKKKAKKAKKE